MTTTLPPLDLASRMQRLGTETAFEVLARAKAMEAEGRDVIHLEIGEPDFDTPANVVEAAIRALEEGWTHYGPAAGLPQTRQAVAAYVGRTRGVEVGPDEVVVVPGGKPTMFYAMLALVEEGDEVLYPNPGFPIYESMIRFSGGTAVPLPMREENAFALTAEDVAERLTERTKMVVLNSPGNPTGGVVDRARLEAILGVLADRPDVWILSDEIYSRLIYGDLEHASPLSYPDFRDRVILLDGWSKTYAMTGWRLGFGVMRPDLAALFAKLMVNSNSCTASFSQIAAIEALEGDQTPVEEMKAEFDRRRRRIVELLDAMPGVRCHLPEGAFYVFPNVSAFGLPAKELQDRILDETGVACLAGTSFGEYGEGYLRFSYANSLEKIEEAMQRVGDFFSRLPQRGAEA